MRLELQMTMLGEALAKEQDEIRHALVARVGLADHEFALVPKRPPIGGLGAIDPTTATFIVQILGATSVTAVATGIARVALEWVRVHHKPMKLRVGHAQAEVPAGASVDDVERIARVLAGEMERPASKPTPRSRRKD
jgi:hypothetical protein